MKNKKLEILKAMADNYIEKKSGSMDSSLLFYIKQYLVTSGQRGKQTLDMLKFFSGADVRGKTVLDAGCGLGGLVVETAKRTKEAYGIDMDREQMEIAKKISKLERTKPKIIYMDAAKSKFKSNRFDVIFCIDVLEHTYKQKEILDELHRILKPGGVIFLKIPNRLFFFEPHTYLPFISLMPTSFSDFIIKVFRPEFFRWYRSYKEIKQPTYNIVKMWLKKYEHEIFFSFGDAIPYVGHTSKHSPLSFDIPFKGIFSSRHLLNLLSRKPFAYLAKDWYCIIRKK